MLNTFNVTGFFNDWLNIANELQLNSFLSNINVSKKTNDSHNNKPIYFIDNDVKCVSDKSNVNKCKHNGNGLIGLISSIFDIIVFAISNLSNLNVFAYLWRAPSVFFDKTFLISFNPKSVITFPEINNSLKFGQ